MGHTIRFQDGYSREFYSLIVAEDPLKLSGKQVMANSCLLEDTKDKLKRMFCNFSEEVVKLPAIYCTYDSDYFCLCEVKNIDMRPQTTLFKAQQWQNAVGGMGFYKSEILERSDGLNIGKSPVRNELQRVHWAIKSGDLVQVLKEIRESE